MGESEYALQAAVKDLRVGHLAEHVEAVLAQVLATRASRVLNRVALGQARRVRFKSKGRGLGSGENKRNDTGLRFSFLEPSVEAADPPLSSPTISPSSSACKRARRERNQRHRQGKPAPTCFVLSFLPKRPTRKPSVASSANVPDSDAQRTRRTTMRKVG